MSDDERLADILERVNRYEWWNTKHGKNRTATTLVDAVEMLLTRVERLEEAQRQMDGES